MDVGPFNPGAGFGTKYLPLTKSHHMSPPVNIVALTLLISKSSFAAAGAHKDMTDFNWLWDVAGLTPTFSLACAE